MTTENKQVAWSYRLANCIHSDGTYSAFDKEPRLSFTKPSVPVGAIHDLTQLCEVRPIGLETEQAAPGTGENLLKIAREFIDKHHVSCAEATGNDGVYEEAPLLVEALANVVGYYSYPESAQ